MPRALLLLWTFWLSSQMPVALETNPAGDFALIESGYIGYDDFTDPNLAKWTIDAVAGNGDIVQSSNGGLGLLTLTGLGSYMRYTASPVSPTITIPTTTIQMAALMEWGFDLGGLSEIELRKQVLLGVGGPVAGPEDFGGSPWGNDGWGFNNHNKWYFGYKGTTGYWVQGSTVITEWNPFGGVSAAGPGWLGCRITPDGVGFSTDCSGGSLSLQTGITVSNDWGDRHCAAANYGLTGYPGLQTMSSSDGSRSRIEVAEVYIWKQSSITVIGVPFDYDLEIVMVGGTPTTHPTYTLPARTITWGPSQDKGTPDQCGYTVIFDLYDAVTAPPRFQTLRVRERQGGPILTEISPTAFQPGVFGGDVYTLCEFDLPAQCLPVSAVTSFFFGGQIAPAALLSLITTTQLDAVLVTQDPVGSLLLETGDKALLEIGDNILLEASEDGVGLKAFDSARRTSGDITVNGTSWANLDTGLDLTLAAEVGDVVEVGVDGKWENEAVGKFLDVVSLVGGSPVNAWGQDGAETGTSEGVQSWVGVNAAASGIGGPVSRVLVSGDLSGGTVTLRFRVRTSTATNGTLRASADRELLVWAKNLGPIP